MKKLERFALSMRCKYLSRMAGHMSKMADGLNRLESLLDTIARIYAKESYGTISTYIIVVTGVELTLHPDTACRSH